MNVSIFHLFVNVATPKPLLLRQHYYTCATSISSCGKNAVCVYVCVYLQYGHLVPQLALLLGGKTKLVDDFDSYVSPCFPVFA